ncbi:hypothetical protein UY3_17051 [Chelonia mydas]|uniref:Uncharacterized protein n=1 Tax=Chelonia mydas TaxID=8469 RepID=M7B1D1_CHEMY|nr:hypothetical protein UY3_17051 [Chelonia mydas]
MFGRKIYSSSSLQLQVANHQAMLGLYDFNMLRSMAKFGDFLPEDPKKGFYVILEEGKAVVKAALQAASDTADSAARTMASAISMRRTSWLQLLGLLTEVQQLIQDLPFDGQARFAEQTDTKLHRLKDSRVTLKTLGLATLQPEPWPQPSR